MLAKLGHSAGYKVCVGKKEQSASWAGERPSDLVTGSILFSSGAERFTKDSVRQIDLIWLDGKQPVLAFEIEHSTAMTTGIDRFIELLKVTGRMAEHLVIVAPKSRQRKLNQVLSQSHYIGAPMYMESKVRYLWYLEVVAIVTKFASQQATKAGVLEAIMLALRQPNVSYGS